VRWRGGLDFGDAAPSANTSKGRVDGNPSEKAKFQFTMSQIIKEAFQQLYPDKEIKHNFRIKYSAKFRPYNANVRLYKNNLTFSLSKEWRKIGKDIKIGLIQELLTKIIKEKKQTINIDLYNLFLKNVHIAAPITNVDSYLEESFERVSENYFSGMMETPNLKWGTDSYHKLGSYEYASDSITISTIFKDADQELLDYVMYHEMLHKKFKFQRRNGRTVHHSPEFKRMESLFKNQETCEKGITRLARKHRFNLKRAILSF